MGWKASSVIIQSEINHSDKDILQAFGISKTEQAESQPYEIAIYPNDGCIYIGRYKGLIIVSGNGLVDLNFTQTMNVTEHSLSTLFPKGEICAVSLHSGINHWGFSLLKDGKKIRVKAGDADAGTTIDAGEPLEEELELLSYSRPGPDGRRIYQFGDAAYQEDQVGENIVFQVFSRYTGIPLDQDDDLLFNTSFSGYKLLPSESNPAPAGFSGTWDGEYTLGDGYAKSLKGKKEKFTLILDTKDGGISGSCIDHDKADAEPASINGVLFDNLIWFIKTYPVTYLINDKGESYPDPSFTPISISYTGLYDTEKHTYRGIWHIEGHPFWGEWNIQQVK